MSRYLVKLSSKIISVEWWSQQWCQSISEYADYPNRLERGRAYIRNGAVKEIAIVDGHITARVKGKLPEDYQVDIAIDPVSAALSEKRLQQLKSINTLRSGTVLKEDRELFTVEQGLFPNKQEIKFSCSCPDIASMCKHIAAVLYGIGSILDQEPLLLFQLRGIDVEHYIDQQLRDATNAMLVDVNGHANDERFIEDDLLADLFGIDVRTQRSEPTALHESGTEDAVRVIEISPRAKKKASHRPQSPKQKRNSQDGYVIRQYTRDGVFVQEYSSYLEVEARLSTGAINVRRACSGARQSAGGYQWKRCAKGTEVIDILPLETTAISWASKPIDRFDDSGNRIAHYESVSEAARSTGINEKSIREAAKGFQKHAGGYVWKYSKSE